MHGGLFHAFAVHAVWFLMGAWNKLVRPIRSTDDALMIVARGEKKDEGGVAA
jgi:hypothetical protein